MNGLPDFTAKSAALVRAQSILRATGNAMPATAGVARAELTAHIRWLEQIEGDLERYNRDLRAGCLVGQAAPARVARR